MDLNSKIKEAEVLPPREKYARLTDIAHSLADQVEKLSIVETDLGLNLLNRVIKIVGFPQKLTRTRIKLIQHKLALLNISKVNVLAKQNQAVTVESGTITVADPIQASEFPFTNYTKKEFENFMNQGCGLILSTGSDGIFDTQLRLVEAPEPLLSPNEYKFLEAATNTITITVKSDHIGIADLHQLSSSNHVFDINPGFYKICAYLFDNKKNFRCYYIVLSKTQETPENNNVTLFTLE